MSPKSSILSFATALLALGALTPASAAAVEGAGLEARDSPKFPSPITMAAPAGITGSTLTIDNFTSATVIIGGPGGNTIITGSGTPTFILDRSIPTGCPTIGGRAADADADARTLTITNLPGFPGGCPVVLPRDVDESMITVTFPNGSTLVGPTSVTGSLPPFTFGSGPAPHTTHLPAAETTAPPERASDAGSMTGGTLATAQESVSAGSRVSEGCWLLFGVLLSGLLML